MELIDKNSLVGQDGLFSKRGCPGNCQYCGLWSNKGCRVILEAPTVDAVPVDEIKFHHILINKDGVPEVKLQFGERTLVLRRVDDPLDVVEVVHGQWIRKPIGKYTGVDEVCCSICGCFIGVVASDTAFREAILDMNYCYNCGAKMDGDGG